ncbi:hypothetical protein HMPREF1862_00947 [Varibaculum cambriense]|uniref:Uncharacterized protein n=1 Tax=Varibaculum cambriense TaxID=184870 RepID=A0AB34WZ44_9ACTO|nr:hypothetical protein HMPREF1862_00947 [Varibaculum cambriense]
MVPPTSSLIKSLGKKATFCQNVWTKFGICTILEITGRSGCGSRTRQG